MKKLSLLLIALLLTLSPSTIASTFVLKPGFIYNPSGYTAYRIGGNARTVSGATTISSSHPFPLSELLFYTHAPLVGGRVEWQPHTNFSLELSAFSSPGYQSVPNLEDRDWSSIIHNRVITYSTTDSKVKSRLFSLNALYKKKLTPRLAFKVGPEFALRHHHFSGSNTIQSKPNSVEDPIFISGETITYDQNTFSLGLIGGLTLKSEYFGLTLEGLYAPFTHVEDEDIHIVRGKFNYNDTNGVSTEFKAELAYYLSPIVTYFVQYKTYFLKTDGTQTQIFDGSSTINYIDSSIESHQQSVILGMRLNV